MDVGRVVVGVVIQQGVVVYAHKPVQLRAKAASVDGAVQRGVAGWPGGVESLRQSASL